MCYNKWGCKSMPKPWTSEHFDFRFMALYIPQFKGHNFAGTPILKSCFNLSHK